MKTLLEKIVLVSCFLFFYKNSKAQVIVNTIGNTSLACITVDDITSSTNANGWSIDGSTQYSEDCNTLSINQIKTPIFSFSPNPAKDRVLINSSTNAKLNILDINGRIVVKEKEIHQGTNEIKTNQLSPQLYLIKIISQKSTLTKKLIIR